MTYGYLGSMRTRPGMRDEVVALLLAAWTTPRCPAASCTSSRPTTTDPDLIRIAEVWDSKQAHDGSLTIPEVRARIDEVMPMLTGEFDSHEVTVRGGFGSNLKDRRGYQSVD